MDGTLLTNHGLGVEPFNEALETFGKVRGHVEQFRDSGFTDFEIVKEHGISDLGLTKQILGHYSLGLGAIYSAGQQAEPLPLGKALEKCVLHLPHITNLVISGNFQPNAHMKLSSAGLGHLFRSSQVFGSTEESMERSAIIARATKGFGNAPVNLLIVGDTVRDYQAARQQGASVVLYSDSTEEFKSLEGVVKVIDPKLSQFELEAELLEVLDSIG